jgi:hypothetical protein
MRFRGSSEHIRKRLDMVIQAYEGGGCRRKIQKADFGKRKAKGRRGSA